MKILGLGWSLGVESSELRVFCFEIKSVWGFFWTWSLGVWAQVC